MQDRQVSEESHVELLRRIAARDAAALAELYDQMGGVLFATALHILADRREAEEAVQDVFVQIWTKASTFDRVLGTVFHWALGITRHRCIDYLRVRQRRLRLLEDAHRQAEVETAPAVGSARTHLGADELAAVRAAVSTLPPEQQQAIAMAFYGGMTHPEIAAALREPLGTIKARIRRGMLSLRDRLEEHL